MTVLEQERAKYDRVWQIPEYRVKCHSLTLWREHRGLFPKSPARMIDLGCGLGRILPVWEEEGIEAWGVDLVPDVCLSTAVRDAWRHRVYQATLWAFEPDQQFDCGICTDVMEHLPTEHVAETLRRMSTYCDAVVFKVANFPSRALGDELHLTQQSDAWWYEAIRSAMGGTVTQRPYRTVRKDYVFTWERAS